MITFEFFLNELKISEKVKIRLEFVKRNIIKWKKKFLSELCLCLKGLKYKKSTIYSRTTS